MSPVPLGGRDEQGAMPALVQLVNVHSRVFEQKCDHVLMITDSCAPQRAGAILLCPVDVDLRVPQERRDDRAVVVVARAPQGTLAVHARLVDIDPRVQQKRLHDCLCSNSRASRQSVEY
eukprot:5212560-Pyramimonas_sp.AAC.2